MKLKVCIIGCGAHSTKNYGPSLKKYHEENEQSIELAACCDLDNSKLQEFKKKFGFKRAYLNYHEMLDKENPDAVFVVMPVGVNEIVAADILNAGIKLFVEKPPAKNTENMKKLIAAADKSRTENQVGFNRRYCPIMKKFTSLIAESERIQFIRYDIFRFNRTEHDFYTTAIHGIDAVRHIVSSDYKEINFIYQKIPYKKGNVQNIYMYCTMENGVIAVLNFCPVCGGTLERSLVNADDITYIMHIPIWNAYDSPGKIEVIRNDEIFETIYGDSLINSSEIYITGGFYAECNAFLDAVADGKKLYPTLHEAYQSVEVMECIEQEKGKYIKRESQ